jgi:hypothetical protein
MNVIQPLEIIEYGFGGFSLGFWVGDIDEMEENSVRSRTLIAELCEVLARKDPPKVVVPPPEPREIVVEAPLEWNGQRFDLGFNTFDGVVALDHEERAPLAELMAFVIDAVRVVQ